MGNVGITLAGKGGELIFSQFTFIGRKHVLTSLGTAQKLAKDQPALFGGIQGRWMKHGIPLWEDEDYVLVDTSKAGAGRVYQNINDGDLVEEPCAASFTEFFEQWLASGCHNHGNAKAPIFKRYWRVVESVVPLKIDPAKNGWLRHHGRFYGNPKFPVA